MITIRDIRKGHPFGVSSPTDKDYADIANTIVAMLRYTPFCAERSEDELKRIALKLTLYFEDMVSEIGLWHSFCTEASATVRQATPLLSCRKELYP